MTLILSCFSTSTIINNIYILSTHDHHHPLVLSQTIVVSVVYIHVYMSTCKCAHVVCNYIDMSG